MKTFVIKNKEGKYLAVSSSNYEHYWATIDFAHYFRFLGGTHDAKQEAEEFRNTRYPDCEVVEITIEETKERDVSIRKQVCDEIRDFIQRNESPSFSQSLCGYWFISAKRLFKYLDQIEQAKES